MSDISYDDLCNLIALKINNLYNAKASPHSVDYYLQSIYKVILDQLKLNNRINIKDFGIFEIKDRKSGERIINNPNKDNEKQLVYVKPKKAITFRAAKKFDVSVNENDFKLVSDAKIKKLSRDYRKKLATSKNGNRFKNVVDLLKIANKRKEV